VADVRLVEGVAADDFEVIARAVNADREKARRPNDLAWSVNRKKPGCFSTRPFRNPLSRGCELEVLGRHAGPLDERRAARGH
jgi:hypothetical protein